MEFRFKLIKLKLGPPSAIFVKTQFPALLKGMSGIMTCRSKMGYQISIISLKTLVSKKCSLQLIIIIRRRKTPSDNQLAKDLKKQFCCTTSTTKRNKAYVFLTIGDRNLKLVTQNSHILTNRSNIVIGFQYIGI